MKRALRFAVPLALVLVALVVFAGPRPRSTLRVVGSVTPVSLDVSSGYKFADHLPPAPLLQCPGGIVWYRAITAAELLAGGLVSPGLGMTDGGAFGVLVDFTSMGDPVQITMGASDVAIALLGTDAGLVTWGQTDGGTNQDSGVLPCFVSAP